ncbi:Asp-tRNA(Asn)/Glu-tRNA(Gln) amidotransferase subunit GatA [Helicobacter sp. NHP22-001]|uniref:Asp-tRNA(Asn)/Glu-tRNA(Gln) amidotransferase subunit GatA n=1 Tax=Helicobacter sp. NHP22-001 TaxID=3040202 RepID=UPI00244D8811|nr:Asp-tRNA(Asn)/Glu-tRNA(Gln) amidotransferase subunit GatA [Helicobacter sp. NHP22-001]GMB96438.1 Aspartyl/glutamyl-tRNA amidotransferase subunit A GatA [Helicobacter sp. NHP22-001]
MVTLTQAMGLAPTELEELKKQIAKEVGKSDLNAYIRSPEQDGASGGGVPILIKDNINVKGWAITCASQILQGYIAPYHASVVERLHQNGMCAFGVANMDEFAMGSTSESSCYGAVKNPRDLSRVAGGSSGGCASAVAGGLAIAALGSDTGGSIRQPASYCGCVGLKPTYGRVSRYGLVAYSSSLDQIGPITQNVQDCALLLDAISGHDPKDSTSVKQNPLMTFKNLDPNKRFKIGVLEDYLDDADPCVQKAYFDTTKLLEDMGHEIVPQKMANGKFDTAAYYIISTAEACSNLARFDGVRYGRRASANNLKEIYTKSRTEGFGAEVKRRIMLGNFVLSSGYYEAYYQQAQKARVFIRQQYAKIFNEVDILLAPVAPSVAPKFNAHASPLEMYLSDIYTVGVNLAGLPAISLPVSKSVEGLPVGLQLVAPAFEEQRILDTAFGLEDALSLTFKGIACN